MPSPQLSLVQQLLSESGVGSPAEDEPSKELSVLLKEAHLGPKHLLERLREIVEDQSPHVAMRGVEAGLKLNRLLADDGNTKVIPVFNITINGAAGSVRNVAGVNPILIPRELTTLNGHRSEDTSADHRLDT